MTRTTRHRAARMGADSLRPSVECARFTRAKYRGLVMSAALRTTSLLCALTLFACGAHAKTIVCIEPTAGDGFLNGAEGWYRTQFPVPPNIISTAGNLQDCLAQAVKGDRIIIVSHGLISGGVSGGGFFWGPTPYSGFGGGTGVEVGDPPAVTPHPLPPGLSTLNNITIQLVQCWSDRDPDGNDPKKSVVLSLRDALTGPGVVVTGYGGRVNGAPGVRVTGGSKEQRDAAEIFLTETNASWMDNPPPNRPGPPVPNQRTAAQQLLDTQFPGKGLTVTILFREPVNVGGEPQTVVAESSAEGAGRPGVLVDEACGEADPFIDSIDLPLASGAASAALGMLLLASGWVATRRRARA
jgi:hypothetical protein